MTLFSCRDHNDPGDQLRGWKTGEIWMQMLSPGRPILPGQPCVLFVHGFAAKPQDAIDAYQRMAIIYHAAGYAIYGFTWPSEGKVTLFNYWIDFGRHIYRSSPALRRVVLELSAIHSRVVIQAHSMGTVLVSEALLSNEIAPLIPELSAQADKIRVIFHGGDATRTKFSEGGEYALNANRVNRLHSFYSASDLILGIIGKLVRPTRRIGSAAIEAPPENFESHSAEGIAATVVRHDTYKFNARLLEYSAMLGNDV